MADRRLVTLDCHFRGVSRSTLWRMRQDPLFPRGINIRGRLFFVESELETYEEARRSDRARDTAAPTRERKRRLASNGDHHGDPEGEPEHQNDEKAA
jgi:predicted DNA-binding transcriptional regulator AlpA